MDQISLRTELACIVGILPRERIEPQRLIVDATLELDLEGVGATGELAAGVDYASVDAQIRFLAVEGRFRLLESLALAVLQVVLAPPAAGEGRGAVHRATIAIAKPDVLRAARPGIRVSRDAGWARDRARLSLPEVEVDRIVAAAGEVVRADAAFSVTESCQLPLPWTAPGPAVVLAVRRR